MLIVTYAEPTVIPAVVLELCSAAILHRFASPAWFDHIKKHVPADLSAEDAFMRIVQLKVRSLILVHDIFADHIRIPDGRSNCPGTRRDVHQWLRCYGGVRQKILDDEDPQEDYYELGGVEIGG